MRSGQQIAFGRQSAPGRRFALGPAMRVRPAIRVRPTVGVWPGKTRLASKARFTSRIRKVLHQQGDFPPANPLTTSKPTSRQQARSPNDPSYSGTMPTGEQAGPDGTPPKALNHNTLIICVSMIDSVCPRTYSSGGPIKNLVCCCLCFLEPTECHVGQNCFGYSTSSELTVLVTFNILPRRS